MALHPATARDLVDAVKAAPVAFVKWSASFCGPCKRIQPLYDTLAQTYAHEAVFLVVEADQEEFEALAEAYHIAALPTFQVFVDRKLVTSFAGADPKTLEKKVREYIKN